MMVLFGYGNEIIKQGTILTFIDKVSKEYDTKVKSVRLQETEEGKGILSVNYDNGYVAVTEFMSFNVMKAWVSRKRSWKNIPKVINQFQLELQ